ncbi:MAG TPA: dienelactone hydrolase family protein [Acidobacteriota bacterium]|nr:dienelactone hydrolase family protein [Acidobacteriota bacterium]
MIHGTLQSQFSLDYVVLPSSGKEHRGTLMVLHGFGQTAEDFAQIFRPVAEEGFLIAAPQAPHPFYLNRQRELGFTWLTRYQRDRSVEELLEYLTDFYRRLEEVHQLEVQPLALFGFSQGSSIAYRLWVRRAFPIRVLFSCGADLPPDVDEALEMADRIPVHILHGSRDHLVPPEVPRQAHDRLKARGFPASRRQYPCAHEITPEMLSDVARLLSRAVQERGE